MLPACRPNFALVAAPHKSATAPGLCCSPAFLLLFQSTYVLVWKSKFSGHFSTETTFLPRNSVLSRIVNTVKWREFSCFKQLLITYRKNCTKRRYQDFLAPVDLWRVHYISRNPVQSITYLPLRVAYRDRIFKIIVGWKFRQAEKKQRVHDNKSQWGINAFIRNN